MSRHLYIYIVFCMNRMMAITAMTIIETKDKILKCLLFVSLSDSPSFPVVLVLSQDPNQFFDNHLNLVYLYGHFDVYGCYYYLF